MKAFTVGIEVKSRSVCDHDCIFSATVTKRTAKMVTFAGTMLEPKTCKIHVDCDGNEFAFPYGQYSMAPVFKAV